MKFEFNGLSFDTTKPVFVLGHTTKERFFISYFSERQTEFELRMLRDYGAKTKRKYVRTMGFSGVAEKNNELETIGFGRAEIQYREGEIIIGHSPKECLKILKEKYINREDGEKSESATLV